MIQRIQSLYMLTAGMLTGSLFVQDFAEIIEAGVLHVFNARGIFKGEELVYSGLPLMILMGIIVVLHLVAIFLYKKRILQIRLLVFSILLLLGLFGLFFYFTYASFNDATIAFKVPVALPVVSIILDWLAIRAIGKDEALIRSIDRIR